MPEIEPDSWLKLGVAADLTRHYSADQRDFMRLLALLLQDALPDETTLEQRGGLFAKKSLHRLTVSLGTNRYSLEDPGRGPLLATRTHIVKGIALKTEEVAMPEWIAELGAVLEERARGSEAAREALSRLVGNA